MENDEITYNSIIDSGLSPQGGACFTIERRLPNGNINYYPTCLGGIIAGKTTIAALTLAKDSFRIDSFS